jgi:hypothetical protein
MIFILPEIENFYKLIWINFSFKKKSKKQEMSLVMPESKEVLI